MKLFVYNLREFDEKRYFDSFCEKYGYIYSGTPDYPEEGNINLARGVDAICIIPCPIDKAMIDRFHSIGVKYIITRSVGVDHIDVEYARSLGIRISNVSYSPNSVANYTIMLMLMSCRRISRILSDQKRQNYTLKGKMGLELSNCTVGIIGTGQIGRTVIRHISGFGCRILAYSPHEYEEVKAFGKYVPFETLLEESDIISLHTPGLPSLYHLINHDRISMMKDGVILINAARGSLVDSEALIANLHSGKIGFAALDTIEHESGLYYKDLEGRELNNPELEQLNRLPNVIISPHMAFYTDQAVSDQIACILESLHCFENGLPNKNEI